MAGLTERGWVADGTLTADGRAARAAIEAATDIQESSVVARLAGRLDEVCGRLDAWGLECIAAGAFPTDPRKRAAG